MTRFVRLFASAAILSVVSACVPLVAAGAGASLGVASAKEGGIKGSVADKGIYLKITNLWMKHSLEMYRKLELDVDEGRVLIAGSVPTAQMRLDAVRLAWQADGVRQVINEVKVDEGGGISGYVKDSWIATSIRTAILASSKVQSVNYSIEAVNGAVYVMGVAQNQQELDQVLNIARNTRFVKKVVSYVRLRGETLPAARPPANVDVAPL